MQRRHLKTPDDEAALTAAIVRLATRYGRYGYRRIREMLVAEGWRVNVKRVYRIWRREGLKVPSKQPKRGRLWLNDGSCVRLRPERPNHVWSYDFVQDRTEDGRAFRMLVVLDEFTRRCLAILVAQTAQIRRRAPLPGRSLRNPRSTRTHSVRQRPGVRRDKRSRMAWPDRRQDALHRTGKSLGERLLREPELKAQRRAAKRRNLHDDAGGASADRELETPLQCHPPALVARLSAAGPRGDLAASVRSALRSASASPDAGRRRPGAGNPGGAWSAPSASRGTSANDIFRQNFGH